MQNCRRKGLDKIVSTDRWTDADSHGDSSIPTPPLDCGGGIKSIITLSIRKQHYLVDILVVIMVTQLCSSSPSVGHLTEIEEGKCYENPLDLIL